MKSVKETGERDEKQQFRKTVSFWSFLTVSWLTPILKRAKAGPLALDDLFKASIGDSAEYLSRESQSFQVQVATFLGSGRTQRKPDLRQYLYGKIRWKVAGLIILSVLDSAAFVSIPFFMRQLILVVEDSGGVYSHQAGYIYSAALFFSILVQELSFDLYFMLFGLMENSIAGTLGDMILKKTFRLSDSSKTKFAKADIMSLMQTEVNFAKEFFSLYSSPLAKLLQIFLQCFFLYRLLGLSFLISASVIGLVTFLSMYISASLDYWMTGLRETTNARVSIVREFLKGEFIPKLSLLIHSQEYG